MVGRNTKERHHGRKCCYCPRLMDKDDPALFPTRDHYPVPKSRGGTRTLIACYSCNHIKGDMLAEDWQRYMAEHPEWWTINRAERHAAAARSMGMS